MTIKQSEIDLGSALGETFSLPPCGVPLRNLAGMEINGARLHARHSLKCDEEGLLQAISTGYVACGGHSGDAIIMGRTVRMLAQRGIAVGAHPSYPDIFGFGQNPVDLCDRDLEDVITVQLAPIATLAASAGSRLAAVKCHGALAYDVSYDERTAQVIARTIYKLDPSISLVCLAGSPCVRVAQDCGIRVVQEAYIDRAYDDNGRIANRKREGALITEPVAAVRQLLSILEQANVTSLGGVQVPMHVDSFCLQSDTPNSAGIIDGVVRALAKSRYSVRPPHPFRPIAPVL
jgi:UPF0271 protein